MSVLVRRATAADAFALAALAVQAGREAGAPADRGFLVRWADAWLADLAHRPAWVAEADGVPVGSLLLLVSPRLPRLGEGPRRSVSQVELYVAAAHRRRGTGARLAREAASWARSEDVDGLVDVGALGPASGIARALRGTAARAGERVGEGPPSGPRPGQDVPRGGV